MRIHRNVINPNERRVTFENEQESSCYLCKKRIDIKQDEWFYICQMLNLSICRNCQLNPKTGRMCPLERTGTPEKPHIHNKIIGIL